MMDTLCMIQHTSYSFVNGKCGYEISATVLNNIQSLESHQEAKRRVLYTAQSERL